MNDYNKDVDISDYRLCGLCPSKKTQAAQCEFLKAAAERVKALEDSEGSSESSEKEEE